MRIALDATYSVDPHPTGIGIYSQAILFGLADTFAQDDFVWCYRPKQFFRAVRDARKNVRRRFLQPGIPTFRANIFHALNQRVDRRPAKKVVTTFHDLFVMTEQYSSAEFRERFTNQARHAAQNSDLIITVSEFTADQVTSLLGFPSSCIRVIPHGVIPPRETLKRPRERIVLFAGVLQTRKNIVRLVDAFNATPSDWRLILAGASTGYGAESILAHIERSPSRNRIQVLGYVSPGELESLYARVSVFAFPSLDEGFGMPVLEAMAYGVPVIASNRPPLIEVAHGAALFIDPKSTDELASALHRFISDPSLRHEYANRGRERAEAYPWERAIRKTYSVYRELIA